MITKQSIDKINFQQGKVNYWWDKFIEAKKELKEAEKELIEEYDKIR